MNDPAHIHVSIGEVKVGRNKNILKASLGSCVGIGFLWKKKNLYGLAHCLLPETDVIGNAVTARFVNQAIPSLVALMKIRTLEDCQEIEVVLAGGGNMTAPKDSQVSTLVGHLNVKAAEKILKEMHFKISHREVGGETGRKIWIFCETGEFRIDLIPRIQVETG